jgi:hypothetical protein
MAPPIPRTLVAFRAVCDDGKANPGTDWDLDMEWNATAAATDFVFNNESETCHTQRDKHPSGTQ